MTSVSSSGSPGPRQPSLLGSSAIMAAGTVVSRLTGFARAAIIAAALGLTVATADVFNVPNVIPNMLYILVGGGILNSVLVPVLVRAIKNDADGGEAYSQRLFSLSVTVLAIATVLAVLAAPLLIRAIVDERYLEPDMRPFYENMVSFARFCLPQIFFYGLYVLIGQILNAKGRFGPMMWSPILNNVVAIAVFAMYLIVFGTKSVEPFDTSEVLLLGLGSTAGVAAQALILVPVLRKTGFSLRFRTDWRGHGLSQPIQLGMWTFGFVVVNQVAYLFFVNIATGASAGGEVADGAGYSVYANAMLIMMVPHSIITVSLATALLPRLSDLAADGHFDEVRARLVSAVRACLAIIIPLGALMAVLAFPLTALIFDHGSAQGQTAMLARTLIALIPGLVAFTVHYLCLRGFYALQDTRTPFFTQVWIAGVMVVWAIGMAVIEPSPEIVTLTLATGYSAAYLVGATVSVVRLQHEIGEVNFSPLVRHLARLIVPVLTSSLLAWLVWQGWTNLGLLDGLPAMIARFVELAISGSIGLLSFVGLAYAFKIVEVRRAVEMIQAKIRGEAGPEGGLEGALAGHGLEDTTEHGGPIVETGTLSIFRPALDPDVTVEFFLDETMHGATLHGVPSVSSTSTSSRPQGRLSERGVGNRPRVDPLDVDTQPDFPLGAPDVGAVHDSGQAPTLAGRYRVDRLLNDVAGVRSWYGFDTILQRPVFVQTLAADDARSDVFVTAARHAATLDDPRFLRVLDIGTEHVSYLVREWTPGRSLAGLLAYGPFSITHASAIGREVADAMSAAHARQLFHRQLSPTLVFLTAEGSVKIAGLETEAVLYGPAEVRPEVTDAVGDDPVALDAAGVGGVLYSCLTAHWPIGEPGGLAPAPRIDSGLASARQVRPGVPTPLNVLIDRAIGNAWRHHAQPLRSPQEIVAELGAGPRTDEFTVFGRPREPEEAPAVVGDLNGSFSAASNAAPAPLGRARRRQRRPSRLNRFLGVFGAALLLVGATLVGLQLMLSAFDSPENSQRAEPAGEATTQEQQRDSTPTAEPEAEPTPLDLAGSDYFDPFGSTPENPQQAPNAIDGDPETAWQTLNYYDPLEAQKDGVGLYVDLGADQAISEIQLTLLNADTDLQVRVAPEGSSAAPGNLDEWRQIHEERGSDDTVALTLDQAVTTRYVLVWFTRLPIYEDNYRSGVAEVTVLGVPG